MLGSSSTTSTLVAPAGVSIMMTLRRWRLSLAPVRSLAALPESFLRIP